MRRLIRLLPVVVIAAAFAPTAQAQVRTLTFTVGPISVPAYGVATQPVAAPSPKEDGYVVGLKAEIVDAKGVVQGRDKVMLHHIVFGKVGTPDATYGGGAERFYAEGIPVAAGQRLTLNNPYQYERISISVGTLFSWTFVGTRQHDVTLVNGPVGFSTPWTLTGTYSRKFTKRGTYELFCSLHPSQMTQRIVVRQRTAQAPTQISIARSASGTPPSGVTSHVSCM